MSENKNKIHCPNCSTENPSTADFCMSCGHELLKDEVPAAANATADPQGNNRFLFLILGIIIGLLIILAALFWVNARSGSPSTTHQVRYEVVGGTSDVNVTYSTTNGRINEQALRGNATLNDDPWQHEFSAENGEPVSLSVEDASGASIPVTCRIYIDDQLWREASGTSADCSGTIGA